MPEISLKDILIFATGASAVPPLGFEPNPKIRFVAYECLPFTSSCDNSITFPLTLENYSKFKQKVVFGLCGSHGFGHV